MNALQKFNVNKCNNKNESNITQYFTNKVQLIKIILKRKKNTDKQTVEY